MNSIEEFIEYLKIKNPKLFEDEEFCILEEKYSNMHEQMKVRTKYGEHIIIGSNLRKNVPSIRSAINKKSYAEKILEERNIHFKKGEFIVIDYLGKDKLLLESCYGQHIMTLNCLLSKNSSTTVTSAIDKELFIINKMNSIQNNIYNYKNFKYENIYQKIDIECKKHGWFQQSIDKHLQGSGCSKCGREATNKYLKENNNGWGWKSWYKQGKKSKNFDSFKCYVIRCWNEEEEFYKIGKTYTTIEARFSKRKLQMPYNYEIKYISASFDAEYISKLEKRLLGYNKNNKYKPRIFFYGLTECFSKVNGL